LRCGDQFAVFFVDGLDNAVALEELVVDASVFSHNHGVNCLLLGYGWLIEPSPGLVAQHVADLKFAECSRGGACGVAFVSGNLGESDEIEDKAVGLVFPVGSVSALAKGSVLYEVLVYYEAVAQDIVGGHGVSLRWLVGPT
jgi:hypothetical protein